MSIGACSNFAAFAGSAIQFDQALTVINIGSVGVSPGVSITGNYETENGYTQSASGYANQCASDLKSAFHDASTASCNFIFTSAYLSGTLTSGIYCTSPGTLAISPWTQLTLDAKNDPTAQWIFQAASTVITGVHSSIVLINGAQVANVYWSVGSSATLGDSSTFVGQILAQASVTVGANAFIKGRALAQASIAFQGGAYMDMYASNTILNVTIGSCSNFVVLAATSISFGTGRSVLPRGSIGVYPGTSITGNYTLPSGSVESDNIASLQAEHDLAVGYNRAMTAACQYSLASGDLSGLTLISGVYCSTPGTFSIAQLSYVALDGKNAPQNTWIFQTTTTVITGTDSSMILTNGALSKNVFWAVGSTVNIGYSAFVVGNFMASSTISMGSFAKLDGRLLSMSLVTIASYSSASTPKGTTVVVYPSLQVHLGACKAFAILAGSAAVLNLAIVHSGSVGSSPGTSITGNYQLDAGTTESATASAVQCAADQNAAFSAAMSAVCTSPIAADISSKTLIPGVYCAGTFSMIANSILLLDARGDVNGIWIFQAGSTVITGVHSAMYLVNGGQLDNVWWAVGSSATTGVSSIFVGNIVASASVTIGARSVLQGRALADAAVTANGGSWIGTGYTFVSGKISLGSCLEFAVLAGDSITFNSPTTTIASGSIGVSPGTTITGPYYLQNGNTYLNSANAKACAISVNSAYNDASVATCQHNLAASDLSGLTLLEGVYCSAPGTFSIAASSVLYLDARNVPSAQWVFQTDTTVITGASSSIALINGANAANIWWAVGTSATIGTYSVFVGTLLTHVSVTLGYRSKIIGRTFAMSSVTLAGDVTVIVPPSPTVKPTSSPTSAPTAVPTTLKTYLPTSLPTRPPIGKPILIVTHLYVRL